MNFGNSNGFNLYIGIIALAAALSGLIMFLEGIGLITGEFSPDPVQGLVLVLISALLFSGLREQQNNPALRYGYSYIGSLLAVIFALCTVVIEVGAGVVQFIEEGSFDLSPLLHSGIFWVGIFSIPIYFAVIKVINQNCSGCSQ